ncbi:MAG: hypothetical protein HC764_20785 [Pleurocapsa sp. CRU_1_2]|nr:hypothetical protein [Pleurocapsa sp. CRU_1_2]
MAISEKNIMAIKLSQLLQQVSEHPQGSKQWRRAMHHLLIELQNLPGLLKSSHPDYLDALNQNLGKVSRDICCEFQPRSKSLETSLVHWINGYLYWRIKDLYSCNVKTSLSLDIPINKDGEQKILIDILEDTGITNPILNGLDRYIEQLEQEEIQCLVIKILDYLEKDPQNHLKNCYYPTNPHCHCQLISQKRFLQEPAQTFKQISQDLDISSRKLMNHWYGRCIPLLQQISSNLGYRKDNSLFS